MRPLNSLQEPLKQFEETFGLPILNAEQGSETWHKVRLGVITASNISRAVAKFDSDTRHTYMCELVAQVCTGQTPEDFNARAMQWGKDNEARALSAYMFQTNFTVTPVSFLFKDNTFRTGCSPDGIIDGTHGLELKCPYNTANYIKFLTDDTLKSEWQKQVQFCMWVTDAQVWDVSQYDIRMKTLPIHTITVERDEKQMKVFDDLIPQFISDMDQLLEKCGTKFSQQWRV